VAQRDVFFFSCSEFQLIFISCWLTNQINKRSLQFQTILVGSLFDIILLLKKFLFRVKTILHWYSFAYLWCSGSASFIASIFISNSSVLFDPELCYNSSCPPVGATGCCQMQPWSHKTLGWLYGWEMCYVSKLCKYTFGKLYLFVTSLNLDNTEMFSENSSFTALIYMPVTVYPIFLTQQQTHLTLCCEPLVAPDSFWGGLVNGCEEIIQNLSK